jgi:hypothetical protein
MVGLAFLPGVLVRFGQEDTAEVLGRLTCVGCEIALGLGMMLPLLRGLLRGNARRHDHEDRDW